MKVVSNTSPLCYLLLIEQVYLLPALFTEINVPRAICLELADEGSPQLLRDWIAAPPSWLKIHSVTFAEDVGWSRLHLGEREALVLAQDLSADLLIVDEKAARDAAIERGLKVTGLLGILDEAATRGWVDLPEAIDRLRRTNFRASPSLLKTLLDRHTR